MLLLKLGMQQSEIFWSVKYKSVQQATVWNSIEYNNSEKYDQVQYVMQATEFRIPRFNFT